MAERRAARELAIDEALKPLWRHPGQRAKRDDRPHGPDDVSPPRRYAFGERFDAHDVLAIREGIHVVILVGQSDARAYFGIAKFLRGGLG
jgi:hypothetical protein